MSAPRLKQFRFPTTPKDPEVIKRNGWKDDGILVVNLLDPKIQLSWPERELLRTVGEKLYGKSFAVKAGAL